MNIYEKVKERFLRYVKINTTSMHNGVLTPTTACQFDLARILYQELIDIGASNVYLDEKNCIVYASILKNVEDAISFGLIAHMDTSPDVSGENVRPWVCLSYDGKDVVLNQEEHIIMETSIFHNLLDYIGQDIVFTDGTTLLGGDDKAAIAEIMTLAEYLIKHPEIPHGNVQIAFTPDEEVGGLAKDLDFKRLAADIAYTVDGDHLGYYSDETFNATEAQISIKGKNVHPGTAYGIMVNAIEIASELISMLPKNETPAKTKDREGYYHPHYINGNVEEASLYILLRDHDDFLFEKRKDFISSIVEELNLKYDNRIRLEYKNSYSSMKKVVDQVPYMMEDLVKAISTVGIKPYHLAFRGGTDGSSISQRGLPCPNISAGYENGHSRYEFVPIQSMVSIVHILIELTKKLSLRLK